MTENVKLKPDRLLPKPVHPSPAELSVREIEKTATDVSRLSRSKRP